MESNQLIEVFLNVAIWPVVVVSLCLILPPLFIFKFMLTIYNKYFSNEDMNGKVVLITGASSGIGEELAYEYARKGASLVIVARRKDKLEQVAERARGLGSPDVLPICADVSQVHECKRFVDEAIKHFGQLDHLVNNAGIASLCRMEAVTDITKFAPIMDVNFWGAVYPTHFALPHLKKTRGTVVVNSSVSAFLNPPRMSFYSASKAALLSFYDAMRVELASEITITIATLGFIDSEITQGKLLSKNGVVEMDPKIKNSLNRVCPVMSSNACAKAIVDAACRGERYVTEPKWYRVLFVIKSLCPELIELCYQIFFFKPTKLG